MLNLKRAINIISRVHQPRIFWLITFIAAYMSTYGLITYFKERDYGFPYFFGIVCFAVLKTEIITAAYILMRRNSILKVLLYVFWGIFISLSIVNFTSIKLYEMGISFRLINVLIQTNLSETKGFMPGMLHNITACFLSLPSYISIIGIIVFAIIIKKCNNLWFNNITLISGVIGIGYFGFYLSQNRYNRTNHFIIAYTLKCYYSIIEGERKFSQKINELTPLLFENSISTGASPCNVLLVIGESASKNHHSIYGYPLQTTPNLNALKDSINIYSDVIGSSASTGDCVPKILTFESDVPHDDTWCDYPSIFQVFNKAKYKTFWISNQDRIGNNKGTYSAIASQATVVKYIGSENVNDHMNARFDEAILPELRNAIADTTSNKIIVLHLFGSHSRYADRYPIQHSRFKSNDILHFNHNKWITKSAAACIAEYDNSIHYTDSVLGEMIKSIRNYDSPCVMIYVSDHGENVYDDRNFIGRDSKYVQVPMFIYMNSAYLRSYPEMKQQVKSSLNRQISSSMIIHALMSLTGVKYQLYNNAEDFLSDDFQERVRYSDGLPYTNK